MVAQQNALLQRAQQEKVFGGVQDVNLVNVFQQQVPWYAQGVQAGNIGVCSPQFTVTSGVSQPAISYTANTVMAQKG